MVRSRGASPEHYIIHRACIPLPAQPRPLVCFIEAVHSRFQDSPCLLRRERERERERESEREREREREYEGAREARRV